MDHTRFEQIGEQLRSLGHERREVVEQILRETDQHDQAGARDLYQRLDQVSEQCITLMQAQRDLIRSELDGQ